MELLTKRKLLLILYTLLICSFTRAESCSDYRLIGSWKSLGYGNYIEVTDSVVKAFDVCQLSCLPKFTIPWSELNNLYNITLKDYDSMIIKVGITEYNYVRIKNLPEFCKEPSQRQKEDPLFNFESLWHTFNEHYAYFEERKIDWNNLKKKYKPRLSEDSSELDLYVVLYDMLNEIGDGHVSVNLPQKLKTEFEKINLKDSSLINKDLSQSNLSTNVINYYLKNPSSYNKGILSWGQINQDIAYININSMDYMANYSSIQKLDENSFWDSYWKRENESDNSLKDNLEGTVYIMDKIVSDIRNAQACIIDVRFNGGGYDAIALAIMNYFSSERKIGFTKKSRFRDSYTKAQKILLQPTANHFNGKVYILTSPRTASAAEIFVLSSLVYDNVKRIGSNTTGILSDKLVKSLPNGWEYTLSNEVYESAEGLNYEDIGIPPDFSLEYGNNSKEFYTILENRDQSTDEAIELIIEMTKKRNYNGK